MALVWLKQDFESLCKHFNLTEIEDFKIEMTQSGNVMES